jgi:hypothetical protein
MRPGVARRLAAVAIFACAFGPMPVGSTAFDQSIGSEGVETPRKAIDNFLADSRRYFGL